MVLSFDQSLDLAWEQFCEDSSKETAILSEEDQEELLEEVLECYGGVDLDDHPF